jgi:hypothetical protein
MDRSGYELLAGWTLPVQELAHCFMRVVSVRLTTGSLGSQELLTPCIRWSSVAEQKRLHPLGFSKRISWHLMYFSCRLLFFLPQVLTAITPFAHGRVLSCALITPVLFVHAGPSAITAGIATVAFEW